MGGGRKTDSQPNPLAVFIKQAFVSSLGLLSCSSFIWALENERGLPIVGETKREDLGFKPKGHVSPLLLCCSVAVISKLIFPGWFNYVEAQSGDCSPTDACLNVIISEEQFLSYRKWRQMCVISMVIMSIYCTSLSNIDLRDSIRKRSTCFFKYCFLIIAFSDCKTWCEFNIINILIIDNGEELVVIPGCTLRKHCCSIWVSFLSPPFFSCHTTSTQFLQFTLESLVHWHLRPKT